MILHLADYVQAVRDRCPIFENRVAGAAEWAALSLLEEEAPDYPAAYVCLENEQGRKANLNCEYKQSVDVSLAVIVVIGIAYQDGEHRGQAALLQVDTIREQLFKALLFWTPAPGILEKLSFDGAEVIRLDAARMVYRFDFKTKYDLGWEDTYQSVDYASYPPFKVADLDLSSNEVTLNGKILLKQE